MEFLAISLWMSGAVFQYFHEYLGDSTRPARSSRRQFRMVRLKVLLKIRSGMRILILAGIAAACLQASTMDAQDSARSGQSRTNVADRKPANRDRSGEKSATATERSGRSYGKAGKRRPDFNRDERDNRDEREAPSPFFLEGDFESLPASEGFIFVNGEFLSGPYTFRSSEKRTFVNGVMIAAELVRVGSVPGSDDGEEGYGRGGRRRGQGTQQSYAEFLSKRFSESRQVLVAFDGQPPALLSKTAGGNDLLSVLVSESHRPTLLPEVLSFAGPPEAAAKWSDWIASFQPHNEFLAAAQPIVDAIDSVHHEGQVRNAAIRRLESFSYPLTIAGMIMSVFAIGHLMSNPPNGGKSPDEVEMSPEVVRIVTRSLMLVVALSLLDLIWTLLASQAGTMRELNPVGGRLIDDPAKLILFKVAMTALAAGLIFKLRYYRRAQLASWWACLILTLLTVRWLTFKSMLA
jgi:hypothetical protein